MPGHLELFLFVQAFKYCRRRFWFNLREDRRRQFRFFIIDQKNNLLSISFFQVFERLFHPFCPRNFIKLLSH